MGLPPGAIELKGHTRDVIRVVDLPSGDRLVTAGSDRAVRVYSAATGECLRTLAGHESSIVSLAALGGDVVASCDLTSFLRVWDASTGELYYGAQVGCGSVTRLAALGAERFVVASDGDLRCFSHRGGRDVSLLVEVENAHANVIWDVAACGAHVATASRDHTVAIWSADTFERLEVLRGHTADVRCVAMDAWSILTSSADQTIRVYSAADRQSLCEHDWPHTVWEQSAVLIDPGHVLITGYVDKVLQIVELSTGRCVVRIILPFQIYSACVSQGGWIAAAGSCGEAVVFPPPPTAASVSVFREPIAAIRRASCARIVRLALAVANRRR
jgi:WD40 repeat protein